jgi:hypothetical protein
MSGSIKYISDPLYGFIEIDKNIFNNLLLDIVDTYEFQRLRFIKQTGLSFFAYPTANHNRFEHSLGVYMLAKEFINKIPNQEVDKFYKNCFLVASLIHDIGHAAFSHDFEYLVTNIAKKWNLSDRVFSHEDWLMRIIDSPETTINKLLFKERSIGETVKEFLSYLYNKTNIQQFNKKRKAELLPFLPLLSSELDIDRLDYLLRDSYFTGVASGVYDFERIKRSLFYDSSQKSFLVREKDIPALEGFFIARYHMYRLVYFHKTTLSAKTLLTKIFLRAFYLFNQNNLKMLDPIKNLFKNHFVPSVNDYLKIVDPLIFTQIMIWSTSDDKILSDLCLRFLVRKLFKPIPLKSETLTIDINKIEKMLKAEGFEPEYYLDIVNVPEMDWKMRRGIRVMELNMHIFEASNIIKTLSNSKQTVKTYILVPTDDLRRAIINLI